MNNKKRLIDADELVRKFKTYEELFLDRWGRFSSLPQKDKARVDELDNCIALVINAPTVDAVEVVHGRWVQCEDWDLDYECSVCGCYAGENKYEDYNVLTPYCPNCGAKMDGKRKDNESDSCL